MALEEILRQARERDAYIIAHPAEFDHETVARAASAIYDRERLTVRAILRYGD